MSAAPPTRTMPTVSTPVFASPGPEVDVVLATAITVLDVGTVGAAAVDAGLDDVTVAVDVLLGDGLDDDVGGVGTSITTGGIATSTAPMSHRAPTRRGSPR